METQQLPLLATKECDLTRTETKAPVVGSGKLAGVSPCAHMLEVDITGQRCQQPLGQVRAILIDSATKVLSSVSGAWKPCRQE